MASCLIDGKVYIGQTRKTLLTRRREHLMEARRTPDDKSKFYTAIKKYGEDSFSWSVLKENVPEKDLAFEEMRFMFLFSNILYNRNGHRFVCYWPRPKEKVVYTAFKMPSISAWSNGNDLF